MYDGYIFGIATCNSIENTQLADAESCDDS